MSSFPFDRGLPRPASASAEISGAIDLTGEEKCPDEDEVWDIIAAKQASLEELKRNGNGNRQSCKASSPHSHLPRVTSTPSCVSPAEVSSLRRRLSASESVVSSQRAELAVLHSKLRLGEQLCESHKTELDALRVTVRSQSLRIERMQQAHHSHASQEPCYLHWCCICFAAPASTLTTCCNVMRTCDECMRAILLDASQKCPNCHRADRPFTTQSVTFGIKL